MSVENNILEIKNLIFRWNKKNSFQLKINELVIEKKKKRLFI